MGRRISKARTCLSCSTLGWSLSWLCTAWVRALWRSPGSSALQLTPAGFGQGLLGELAVGCQAKRWGDKMDREHSTARTGGATNPSGL